MKRVWNGREKGTVLAFGQGVMKTLVDHNIAEWVVPKPKRKRKAAE